MAMSGQNVRRAQSCGCPLGLTVSKTPSHCK